MTPIKKGKGSAIFIHLTKNYKSTAGCVALSKKDFSNEIVKKIDDWVRGNTIKRYGPVREVKKELVIELAFDSVNKSLRHKSGFALRFPRVHRVRWDKKANEADSIDFFSNFKNL